MYIVITLNLCAIQLIYTHYCWHCWTDNKYFFNVNSLLASGVIHLFCVRYVWDIFAMQIDIWSNQTRERKSQCEATQTASLRRPIKQIPLFARPLGENYHQRVTVRPLRTVCCAVPFKRSSGPVPSPLFASWSYFPCRHVLLCLEQFWNISERMTGKGKYCYFQSRR